MSMTYRKFINKYLELPEYEIKKAQKDGESDGKKNIPKPDENEFSGVVLKNLSQDLSTKGHGLYIESQDGDRYIDLRLSSRRPFWGHSHPLEVQRSFGLLNKMKGHVPNVDQKTLDKLLSSMEQCVLDPAILKQQNKKSANSAKKSRFKYWTYYSEMKKGKINIRTCIGPIRCI